LTDALEAVKRLCPRRATALPSGHRNASHRWWLRIPSRGEL